MAQVEVLTDRIGTGLLVASVVGVLAAGLAARPLVVAETDARERAANAILAVDRPQRERGADPQQGDGPDGAPRATATSAPASRATTGAASGATFIDANKQPGRGRARPERAAEPAGGLAAPVQRRQPAVRAHLEQLDRCCAPGRSESSGTSSEKYSYGRPRRRKLRPVARMRPFTATATSRRPVGGPPTTVPVTRVGRISSPGLTCASRPALATVALAPRRARAAGRSPASRPTSSGCDPTR